MSTNATDLPADQVVAKAKELVGRDRVHWSLTAGLLARIEQEGLYKLEIAWYGTPYETAEEFADIELGLARSEFFAYRRLATLMGRDRFQPWDRLSRSQATQIAAVAGMDDVGRWVQLALQLPYPELRRRVERMLKPGEEPFVRVTFRCPESVATLFEAALARTLPIVVGEPDPDPELAKDPSVRFRCVEVLARDYGRLGTTLSALARMLAETYPLLIGAGHTTTAEQIVVLLEDV